ncbi:MAG: AgmX/PglI C-terminal domain-containing protein [Polyangiales bacterium]
MSRRVVVPVVVVVLSTLTLMGVRMLLDDTAATRWSNWLAGRGDAADVPAVIDASEPAPTPEVVDAGGAPSMPFVPPARTVHDRAVRDDIRRRLYQAWMASLARSVDASAGRADPLHAPMPTLPDGRVDPEYVRDRIREDFVPLAQSCYDQLIERQPGVSGRAVAEFTVMGDEHVGGVVDDVRIDTGDSGLAETEFSTCLRESMVTVSFRPPPGRGSLRVRYPFRFTPEPPEAVDGAVASDAVASDVAGD